MLRRPYSISLFAGPDRRTLAFLLVPATAGTCSYFLLWKLHPAYQHAGILACWLVGVKRLYAPCHMHVLRRTCSAPERSKDEGRFSSRCSASSTPSKGGPCCNDLAFCKSLPGEFGWLAQYRFSRSSQHCAIPRRQAIGAKKVPRPLPGSVRLVCCCDNTVEGTHQQLCKSSKALIVRSHCRV